MQLPYTVINVWRGITVWELLTCETSHQSEILHSLIFVSVLAILVSIGIIIWKIYTMRGAFKEVMTLLGDKPDVGKVVKAGKFVKNLMTKDASYESSPRTKDVREPFRKNLNTSGTTRIFKAIEEEFADNPKRAQKYLNKLKTSKLSSISESEVETDS